MAKILGWALFALLLAGEAAPLQAQIYSWRDEAGNLVLSDRPPGWGAVKMKTFAVTQSESVRATRPALRIYRNTYDGLIEHHSSAQGVRAELVRAVIQVESAFNPWARSRKGAMGLMQLMPATAAEFGVLNAFNPAENIRAGIAYLRRLLDKYRHNEELALAAYNAGPAAVDRYGTKVPPYRETRTYVTRIRTATALADGRSGRVIYKTLEIVDGRPVPRYSDTKPPSGAYEVVGRR